MTPQWNTHLHKLHPQTTPGGNIISKNADVYFHVDFTVQHTAVDWCSLLLVLLRISDEAPMWNQVAFH